MRSIITTAVLCAAFAVAGCDATSSGDALSSADAPTAYAHESNNRATLSGDGITGTASVNYVAGTEGWRSTARVRGLDAGDYTFAVNLNGTNQTAICSFTSDGKGSEGCSADTDVPGFNTAVILDSDGTVVASGTFARRGGTRETGGKGGQPLTTTLTGDAEVPGPGDPDGSGTATVTLNRGQEKVCFEISVSNVDTPTAAHIHEAPAGASGPVVVGLFMGAGSPLSGCVSADRDLIAEIAADPSDYYVNVHNAAYPAGAVRGQLSK